MFQATAGVWVAEKRISPVELFRFAEQQQQQQKLSQHPYHHQQQKQHIQHEEEVQLSKPQHSYEQDEEEVRLLPYLRLPKH